MAQYRVTTDQGVVTIEGPDDATQDELEGAVADHFSAGPKPSIREQLPRVAEEAAKSAILGPIRAARTLVTDPTKVAAETPILPIGGAIVAGPAGGAVGEGLRQMAGIAEGKPAPSKFESAFKMALASLAPNAGKTIGTTGKLLKAGFTQPVAVAKGKTLELLGKEGLKDIRPIIFNRGEREAAVNYAETAAKNAGKWTPLQLQEARSTLKDILDNKVVAANSPTGQIVSRAKEAVTEAFKVAKPKIGRAFEATQRAEHAQKVRQAISGLIPRIPLVGPLIKQGGKILEAAKGL